MYIGPWQEYALSKALAQSRLAEPGPATPRLGRLSASHGRSFTPDSSLPTPLALGSGRASARSQRIREGRGSGGGRGRGSQLEKRQQLQRMQKMYGMRGLARTLDVARAEEGGGADALPEVRLSPHARTEPALPPYRTPSAAYLPPEEVGERLLGWVPSPSPREPGRPSKTARPGPELAPPYARQPFSLPGAAGPGPPTTPFLPPLHARERELGSLGAHLPPASLPPANPAAPQIDDELDNEVDDLLEWTRGLGSPPALGGDQAALGDYGGGDFRGDVSDRENVGAADDAGAGGSSALWGEARPSGGSLPAGGPG